MLLIELLGLCEYYYKEYGLDLLCINSALR